MGTRDDKTSNKLERHARKWKFDPDATVVAELDPEGLPLGIGDDHTRLMPAPPIRGDPPHLVLASAWGLLLAFSIYAARDVQAFVLHDDQLAGNALLVGAANGFYEVASTLGPARLRDTIDGAFTPLKQKTADVEGLGALLLASSDKPVRPARSARPAQMQKGRPRPAGEEKMRILLVGASSMQFYLGAELERRLETYKGVVTHRFGKLGTGLARPDMFDWPRQLSQLLATFRPHVVIGQWGGNDGQPMEVAGGKVLLFGSHEWDVEYTRRVKLMVDMANEAGARTIILGMPITRHKKHSDKLEHVNAITKAAAEAAGGMYVSTWTIAVDEKGQARATITHEGKSGPMYLADGVHYARLGANYVAQRLCWQLERVLDLVPADEGLAAVAHYELDSRSRNEKTSYLAYVPQAAKRGDERLPVLFLLHGAGGSFTDFSENAHELLQRLATQHRLVIVTPDGDPDGWYLDSPLLETAKIETYVMNELLPDVEKRLPVTDRRAIGGISMGGNGAIALAIKHPRTFVSVSSMSGAVDLSEAATRQALVDRLGPYEQNQELWHSHSAVHLLRARPDDGRRVSVFATVGTEDRWLEANRALRQVLADVGVVHEYKELPGGHAWDHWVEVLPLHLAFHARELHRVPSKAPAQQDVAAKP